MVKPSPASDMPTLSVSSDKHYWQWKKWGEVAGVGQATLKPVYELREMDRWWWWWWWACVVTNQPQWGWAVMWLYWPLYARLRPVYGANKQQRLPTLLLICFVCVYVSWHVCVWLTRGWRQPPPRPPNLCCPFCAPWWCHDIWRTLQTLPHLHATAYHPHLNHSVPGAWSSSFSGHDLPLFSLCCSPSSLWVTSPFIPDLPQAFIALSYQHGVPSPSCPLDVMWHTPHLSHRPLGSTGELPPHSVCLQAGPPFPHRSCLLQLWSGDIYPTCPSSPSCSFLWALLQGETYVMPWSVETLDPGTSRAVCPLFVVGDPEGGDCVWREVQPPLLGIRWWWWVFRQWRQEEQWRGRLSEKDNDDLTCDWCAVCIIILSPSDWRQWLPGCGLPGMPCSSWHAWKKYPNLPTLPTSVTDNIILTTFLWGLSPSGYAGICVDSETPVDWQTCSAEALIQAVGLRSIESTGERIP